MIINEIKLNLNEDISMLPEKIKKKTREHISNYRIVKESIDARDKSNIKKVYSVEINYKKSENWGIPFFRPDSLVKGAHNDDMHQTEKILLSEQSEESRPIIIGFGPSGMFAALTLAKAGLRPIVLERGNDVDTRTRDVENFWNGKGLNAESNVQFGEGGAGTFSDGKLTTGTKDPRIKWVLEEFVDHGAPDEILYKAKPHIGTDILRSVVKSIRKDIINLGGEVRFCSKVTNLIIEDNNVIGVKVCKTFKESPQNDTIDSHSINCHSECSEESIFTRDVILAIGHSARDTFRWLSDSGIEMEQKPFSIGVRIEHDQDIIDIAQYGRPARELGLPVADYKLNHRCENGRGVYTFCMCPGGRVVAASSEVGGMVTNGMSNHGRDSGRANSGMLVDVRTSDFGSEDVLAGVYFQEKYEHIAFMNGIKQHLETVGNLSNNVLSQNESNDFKKYDSSNSCFIPNTTWGMLRDGKSPLVEECLPEFASEAMREAMPFFGRKIKGFDSDDAKIYAVEARSSSPVRIIRDENFEGKHNFGAKPLHGFYPAGEGAGYAGGIMSAAVDGIKVAEKIIQSNWDEK